MGLATITGLLELTMVGLARAMTELSVTNRLIASQQVFYLAEAGLDRKLAEFRDADEINDAQNIAMTLQATGSHAVTVTSLGGGVFELASTGQVGTMSKMLRMTPRKGGRPYVFLASPQP